MRLAAQAKGGFYPTPDRVVEMIATLVDTPRLSNYNRGKTLRVLDPCCGAGEAAGRLAGAMTGSTTVPVPIETFGVELHKDRAEKAGARLDHALACDLFRTSMANGVFGLLYLNPPYDWDSGDEKRVEHSFLTHCTRYLAEDGLLVFIVPRTRLAVSARYLATHYGNLRCWAFPSPEREVFDQVVLMAYRKGEPSPNSYAESRVREWAYGEPEELYPYDYPVYSPSITLAGDILFATRLVDPVAAAREARASGLWPARRSPTPSGPLRITAPGPSCPSGRATWPCWWRRGSWTTSCSRPKAGASWSRDAPPRRWSWWRTRLKRRSTASG